MAGDWIKMRVSLQRSPKVIKISSALSADRLRVIGGLHAVWSLADEQTEEGFLDGYTFSVIDEMIAWPGFCDALKAVNWAVEKDGGVTFPRFEEHNGQSAKRRAQETDRKRSARSSAPDADKKRTREEKRREEITPIPPSGAFLRFWTSWPKHQRKQAQGKCWSLWRQKDFDQVAPAILAHVDSLKASQDWRKDGGSYVPAPLVYLNQRRWEGAETPEAEDRKVAMP
jgi:hypothetical protein